MTRRLMVYSRTGRCHIMHHGSTLCGLIRWPPGEWTHAGDWVGQEVERLCRSCKADAERSPEVATKAEKGEGNG